MKMMLRLFKTEGIVSDFEYLLFRVDMIANLETETKSPTPSEERKLTHRKCAAFFDLLPQIGILNACEVELILGAIEDQLFVPERMMGVYRKTLDAMIKQTRKQERKNPLRSVPLAAAA